MEAMLRHDLYLPPPIQTSAPLNIKVLELKYFSDNIDKDRGELLSLSRILINCGQKSNIPSNGPLSSSLDAIWAKVRPLESFK